MSQARGALGVSNLVKDGGVNGTVVVEHLLKVVSKDRHVFFPIGGNVAVRHFHGNRD